MGDSAVTTATNETYTLPPPPPPSILLCTFGHVHTPGGYMDVDGTHTDT